MQPFFSSNHGTLYNADALTSLQEMPSESVQCCVTSPPYWGLRDYGAEGQIGLEKTPQEHIGKLRRVFQEIHRVLRKDGILWVNYGDTYSFSADKRMWTPHGKQASNTASLEIGLKRDESLPPKNLLGLPWRLAFALQDDGWFLRCDVIWHKPNPMPESCKDRPTRAHEYLFLFSKSKRYFYNWAEMQEPIAAISNQESKIQSLQAQSFSREVCEPERPGQAAKQHRPNRNPRAGIDTRGGNQASGGIPISSGNNVLTRNVRSVWTIPTAPCPDAHFATFPPALAEKCIRAGTHPGDTVLDPFMGSGTTGMVARNLGRRWLGVELNPDYCALALKRIGAGHLRLTDILLMNEERESINRAMLKILIKMLLDTSGSFGIIDEGSISGDSNIICVLDTIYT